MAGAMFGTGNFRGSCMIRRQDGVSEQADERTSRSKGPEGMEEEG